MKTNGTIIGEGKINNIPKSTNISMRLLPLNYTSSKYKNILHKYYVSRNENNSINKISCGYKNDYLFKTTVNLNKYKVGLKRTESNSTTSITSNTDKINKIKKVTFSTVEIIRIKNYKNYNKLNSYKSDDTKFKAILLNKNENCQIF